MDTAPIIKVFDSLLTAGAGVGLTATAFFVMLAGYQYMSSGFRVASAENGVRRRSPGACTCRRCARQAARRARPGM